MDRGRVVTLVIVAPDGTPLGVLPPFTVDRPHWPEVAEVVDACKALHGAKVTILRLLDAEPDPGNMMGGRITYVAELEGDRPAELRPWTTPLPDDPLRARWARPGGPAADLAWADEQLLAAARPRVGPAVQVKTWNLSSIWRIPTASGEVWLKAVPPFFAHEGAMIHALAAPTVPPLIAHDDLGRILLEDVQGSDQYVPPVDRQGPMIDALVSLQASAIARLDELLATGAPDWRAEPFAAAAEDVVARGSTTLERQERGELDRLVTGLADRFARLADCGIPVTFVHGDFHTGNVRWTEAGPVIFDWGDTGIGNPLLDLPPFDRNLDDNDRPAARARWIRQWRAHAPGSHPERAVALIKPLGALRLAIVYQRFLDGIEQTERRYHEADVPEQLRAAAELAKAERSKTRLGDDFSVDL